MKILILLIFSLFSTTVFADRETTEELVCFNNYSKGGVSCVSKSSIELEKAQRSLVELQKKKTELEMKLLKKQLAETK